MLQLDTLNEHKGWSRDWVKISEVNIVFLLECSGVTFKTLNLAKKRILMPVYSAMVPRWVAEGLGYKTAGYAGSKITFYAAHTGNVDIGFLEVVVADTYYCRSVDLR